MTDEEKAAQEAKEAANKAAQVKEPTIENLLADLGLPEKHQKLLVGVVGGLADSLAQINKRLASLEDGKQGADPALFAGLEPQQRYEILMAQAAAPAQAAQTQMWQSLLAGARGGGGGGSELDQLAASAEKIKGLRSVLLPEASSLQIAMERAQMAQMMAQTRLMNKVAGRETDSYLDRLQEDLTKPEEGVAETG